MNNGIAALFDLRPRIGDVIGDAVEAHVRHVSAYRPGQAAYLTGVTTCVVAQLAQVIGEFILRLTGATNCSDTGGIPGQREYID